MDDFYKDMQNTAADLLREFSQGAVTYVELTPGTGPADDPGPATETVYGIDTVARGVKFKYVDGTNIVASDMQVTMPGKGVAPKMNGFIRGDGTSYKIVAIKTVPPVGTPIVHTVIFRK